MSGFFSRCKLLGRKYLWPHLLLGMIATSLGMSPSSQIRTDNPALHPSSTRSVGNLERQPLQRLREGVRRPAMAVDYWQQHAIRVVLRHLSFTLPQVQDTSAEHKFTRLVLQQVAMLHLLCAQLKDHSVPPQVEQNLSLLSLGIILAFSAALWLATTEGIRAGPTFNLRIQSIITLNNQNKTK